MVSFNITLHNKVFFMTCYVIMMTLQLLIDIISHHNLCISMPYMDE